MKRSARTSLFILVAICFLFVPLGLSQNANVAPAASPHTDVLDENERLPFMQAEETTETREPSSSGLLLKTLGAMLLIVGLIFFGAWALKKMGFGGTKATGEQDELSLTVLSSVSMGSGRTISTIRFGERVLLVGVTPQAFTLLAEESPQEELTIRNPRSVAEMLSEDSHSFDDELEQAQNRLGLWRGKGERA